MEIKWLFWRKEYIIWKMYKSLPMSFIMICILWQASQTQTSKKYLKYHKHKHSRLLNTEFWKVRYCQSQGNEWFWSLLIYEMSNVNVVKLGSWSWSMDSKAALTRHESKIFGINVSIQTASFQPVIFTTLFFLFW